MSRPEVDKAIRERGTWFAFDGINDAPNYIAGKHNKDEEHPEYPGQQYAELAEAHKQVKKETAFHCLIVFSSSAKIAIPYEYVLLQLSLRH